MAVEKYDCIIADDMMLDRDVMEMFVSKIDSLSLKAICNDGLELVNALKKQHVDIVFSDIDMPELSGTEVIQSIENPPVFIFISAHPEHAAESYNLDIVDFIVKPVTLARLMKSVEKAIAYIRIKNELPSAKERTLPPAADDSFFIREELHYVQVNYADVLFVESMGNFSRLQTVQGKRHVTLVSLKQIEEQLSAAGFMRVHKQFIVNLKHVQSISGEGEILLKNEMTIPAGAVYKAALMEEVAKKTLSR